MGHAYRAVQWNPFKRRYDACAAALVLLYLGCFVGVTAWLEPEATIESLLIRGFGTAGFLLLHLVLSIGPLARLDARFLPLLYNRRHLGVVTFSLGLVHGVLSLVQYHALGVLNPLASLFQSQVGTRTLAEFPFQPLGLLALAILFLLAATSHDFWLANLGAPLWKALHMSVYVAWFLLLMHVALGILQAETSPLLVALLALGVTWILGLHLLAAWRERRIDSKAGASSDWIDVCAPAEIADGRAKIALVAGERVAVFRYADKLSAVANACQHQNGPLGEGRIIDGCITCPWHGYQYKPDCGASPAPFTEKVATYDVRVERGRVLVKSAPYAPGTRVEPACIPAESMPRHASSAASEFFVGYLPSAPPGVLRFVRGAALAVFVLAAALGCALAASQRTFAAGRFEFGQLRKFSGVIALEPATSLLLQRPGFVGDQAAAHSHYLLVAPGKHGARDLVQAFDGRWVEVEGTLVHRAGQAMLELKPGSIVALAAPPDGASSLAVSPKRRALGPVTLRGEIVDSKCHLGVMNPGELAAHRACATLCIRGGIPVLFLARGSNAQQRQMLLVGSDGRALNQEVLALVADPVEITGELSSWGDLLVLAAEPAQIRRISH